MVEEHLGPMHLGIVFQRQRAFKDFMGTRREGAMNPLCVRENVFPRREDKAQV
jgi:hypothetical protein